MTAIEAATDRREVALSAVISGLLRRAVDLLRRLNTAAPALPGAWYINGRFVVFATSARSHP